MTVEVRLDGAVQIIRMNRPEKKNAITSAMYTTIAESLNKASKSDEIRVNVLLGTPGAFTAGNDIADFLQISMAESQESWPVIEFLRAITKSAKPIVAGVDGLAIGVGTTMLMHCDHVIATERSLFKTPFVDLGLVPEAGSSLLGPKIFGYQRAYELLALGEGWTGEDAKEAGLVNRLVSEDELETKVLEVAQNIASKPPNAMKLARELIRGDRADVYARMEEEARLFHAGLKSDEAKAAFMAFMAKGGKS